MQEAACRAGSCLHALTVLQGVHMQQVGDGTCSSGSVQHCCACGRAVTPKVHICVYAVTPKTAHVCNDPKLCMCECRDSHFACVCAMTPAVHVCMK